MRRSGFTLLEMVLVVAVILVLVAITYPSIEPMYRQYRVAASADTLKAAMLQARAQAVEEGRPYAFGIVHGKGNFRVAPDGAAFWTGTGSVEDENGTPPFVHQGALPPGIIFTEKDGDPLPNDDQDTSVEPKDVNLSDYNPVVVFLPDGTATLDVQIRLRREGARGMLVNLRSLTGEITIRRAPVDQTGGQ